MTYENKDFRIVFKGVMMLFKLYKKLFKRPRVTFYVYNSIPFGILDESVTLGPQGIGVVINKSAKVGKHCFIGQNVTIGNRRKDGIDLGSPVIGNYVKIHANASIFGNIRVGSHSVIGGCYGN